MKMIDYSWDIKEVTNDYKTHLIEKGVENVKIAIIDSGVDVNHPGLSKNVNKVMNFIDEEENSDLSGHGTMICGQICGYGKVQGIAPNCSIDMYKVLNKNNSGSIKNFLASLKCISKQNYDIVNLSLGFSLEMVPEKLKLELLNLLEEIHNKGTICVSSIGYNDTTNHFPSISSHVITAQSLSKNGDIVNSAANADFFIHSGDHNNLRIDSENIDDDELVSVYIPIEMSKRLMKKYSNQNSLPLGYSYSVGESLSSAKLTGILSVVLSFLKRNSISNIGSKDIYTLLRVYSNLKTPNLYNLLLSLSESRTQYE